MSSKGRGFKTLDKDKYYTPRWCIELLTERIDFSKVTHFLEPCAGDERILEFIPHHVLKNTCEIDQGNDYLKIEYTNHDLIITNPPFSLSLEFLQKSLTEAPTVCYLQRLNWLGSAKRKEFWNSNIPDKLFILSKRPQFLREMGMQSGTDSQEYAWFIWDKLNIVKGKRIEIL